MKSPYPFIVRLFILAPMIIIMSVVWALIGICSAKSLGEVLRNTGNNLLNNKNVKNKTI